MSVPQGLIDIRVVRNDLDFRREVQAYRAAIHRLGPAHGPRLIASEPRLRALLTTHPRGRPVDGEASLHVLPRVHEDAGRLLAVLHDSAEHVGDARAQAARHLTHYVKHVVRLVDRTTAWLSLEEAEAVRSSGDRLLTHVQDLPVAFCHGTFGPASWRWNIQGQTLSLTNLGQAQVLPAVVDFARCAHLWATQPHLADMFFAGYGRTLDHNELLVLDAAAVLTAAEDLHHAVVLRDGDALSGATAALRDAIRGRSSARDCAAMPDREGVTSPLGTANECREEGT
ncbi:aminoglycoside phosphotransferase family protein [Streptomyces sp. NBC_01381]|uniref:hypothetical protein n=1 Tax=Streptomyces sp. NBC_01381 TaxID=2903845 RepID=UPI00225860BE|nr:hypothetical protein [Streptomyces sp. NBC_01381]MCX4666468.1 aminoglycoside phosphotransferase family protein [Streptomyces sp. NBC_01381]